MHANKRKKNKRREYYGGYMCMLVARSLARALIQPKHTPNPHSFELKNNILLSFPKAKKSCGLSESKSNNVICIRRIRSTPLKCRTETSLTQKFFLCCHPIAAIFRSSSSFPSLALTLALFNFVLRFGENICLTWCFNGKT